MSRNVKKVSRITGRASSLPMVALFILSVFSLPSLAAEVCTLNADEGAGSVAYDASGNLNDGVINGAVNWVTGMSGTGLGFHGGASDRVEVADSATLDMSSQITLAGWIKPRVQATQYIIKKALSKSIDGYELGLSSKGVLFVRLNRATSGNTYRLNSVSTYPTGGATWMHVAATYDGTDLKLYINGVLESSLAAPGVTIGSNNLALLLGMQSDGVGRFNGDLDEIHIADTALTAAEVSALANVSAPVDTDGDGVPDATDAFPLDPTEWLDTDGDLIGNNADTDDDNDLMPDTWELQYGFDPLDASDAALDADGDGITNLQEYQLGTNPLPNKGGQWVLDSGTGSIAYDSSGNLNDGVINGAVNWVGGVNGTGLGFYGGASDRVEIADSAALDMNSQITLAGWIKPRVQATQYVIKKALSKSVDGYELGLSSKGVVFVRFNKATAGNTYRLNSVSTYPTDGVTWMHVAATYDGTDIKLYINGVLESTLAAPGVTIGTNNLALLLGMQSDGAGRYNGDLDEIHIADTALTAAEVSALANVSAPLDTDGDGVPDATDAFPLDPTEWLDTDGDLIGNNADTDDDGDLMPDTWEVQYGFDPLDASDAALDADGDGITNLQEYQQGTNPLPSKGGQWVLDTGVGSIAYDTSGNLNDGVINGAVNWVNGVNGTGLGFYGGAADRVEIADTATLDISSQITIAGWIKPRVQATQYVIKKALSKSVDGYELSLSSKGVVFVRFNKATAGNTYRLDSLSAYPTDGATWMHVAATYDGTDLKLYINGVLESSLPAPGLAIGTNNLALLLGMQSDGAGRYNGDLDEVQISDSALTAAEVSALANVAAPVDTDGDGVPDATDAFPLDPTEWLDTDGDLIGNNADTDDDGDLMPDSWELQYGFDPLDASDAALDADGDGITNLQEYQQGTNPLPSQGGQWVLDTGTGSTAYDASDNLNDGVINGAVTWVTGVSGTGLGFYGGATDRVEIADSAALDINGQITLAGWIKPRVQATQYILKKALSKSVDGYELGLSSKGVVFVRFNRATSGNTYRLNSVSTYPTDGTTWMHVAATYDGTDIKLYINGVLESTLAAPGLTIGTNNLALLMGMQSDGVGRYNGDLDEIQIAPAAMSADLIAGLAAIYNQPTIAGISTWQSTPLQQELSTTTVGEKPQSKLWQYDGLWWMVMPDANGVVYVWRLDADLWTKVLVIDNQSSIAQADVLTDPVQAGVVHIVLAAGQQTNLVSLEYVPGQSTYALWSGRPANVSVALSDVAETATISIDSTGMMWLVSDGPDTVEVRYSSYPYGTWSATPVILETGIALDDIAAITTLANNSIGVMWSNQVSKRFGFKVHMDGDDPLNWSADEVPASQSALNLGTGMADDHINLSVTASGVLFAAVKTSYDITGYPVLGLLKRQVDGTWDNIYTIDVIGTRPIVLINELDSFLTVIYSSDAQGGDVVYKQSPLDVIQFSSRTLLMSGGSYRNVSSVANSFVDDLVLIASGGPTPTTPGGTFSVDSVRLNRLP